MDEVIEQLVQRIEDEQESLRTVLVQALSSMTRLSMRLEELNNRIAVDDASTNPKLVLAKKETRPIHARDPIC